MLKWLWFNGRFMLVLRGVLQPVLPPLGRAWHKCVCGVEFGCLVWMFVLSRAHILSRECLACKSSLVRFLPKIMSIARRCKAKPAFPGQRITGALYPLPDTGGIIDISNFCIYSQFIAIFAICCNFVQFIAIFLQFFAILF